MDAHAREAAAATAAIASFYSTVWRLKPGERVIVSEPFTERPISVTVEHAHGDVVLVVTDAGEQLEYDREECGRTF
jgi:Na+-transporting NADH:ubiquinone oxidoreductase subunit NqrF